MEKFSFSVGLIMAIQFSLIGLYLYIYKYKNNAISYFYIFMILINLLGYYLLYSNPIFSLTVTTKEDIIILLKFGVAISIILWAVIGGMYCTVAPPKSLRRIFFDKKNIIISFLVGFSFISILSILESISKLLV